LKNINQLHENYHLVSSSENNKKCHLPAALLFQGFLNYPCRKKAARQKREVWG